MTDVRFTTAAEDNEHFHKLAHVALAGPLGAHEEEQLLEDLLATGPCARCDAAVVGHYIYPRRIEGTMDERRDYSICPVSADGTHGPLRAHADAEIEDTHVSVECVVCGTSTGYPIDLIADALDWG